MSRVPVAPATTVRSGYGQNWSGSMQMPGSQHRPGNEQELPTGQTPREQLVIRQPAQSTHRAPSVSRVQLSRSEDAVSEHDPEAQFQSVRSRLWEPVSSQVDSNPPHVPHGPYDVTLQVSPSVSRTHPSPSLDGVASQEPVLQLYDVTSRERVPVSSQVEE